MTDKSILIISIIVGAITLIDILFSFNAMNSLKNTITKDINKFKNKDATTDIKRLIKTKLSGFNFLEKRLIKTYHLLNKEKEYIKDNIKKVNEITKSYGTLLLFTMLGVVIGLILCFFFKLGDYEKIIPFIVSISLLIGVLIMKVGSK